jgi:large subunit ribosomal protein L13
MAQKTYYPKPDEIERGWVLVDANGRTLGRLASRIAEILIGKNKPVYTPGVDVGDFVVVINAEAVTVTGNKLEDKKYYRHTGYPGGIRETSLKRMLERNPDRVLRAAVWGMVPHNRYGRALMKKLKIYAGPEHPHDAQQPQPLEL